MECKQFREWLAESRLAEVRESPSAQAHCGSCKECRETVRDEQEWRRLFALVPERAPERSLWPQIALAIREQSLRFSMSDALLLFSRRLTPAFAVLVLILGGLLLWSAPDTEADGGPMIAMLETDSTGLAEEPDAILISWAEARAR